MKTILEALWGGQATVGRTSAPVRPFSF